MKRPFSLFFLLSVFVVRGQAPTLSVPVKEKDFIYYVSLNLAIQEGQLEGVQTVGEAKMQGNFGLGSEERLGSELVLLDGKAYGIPWNGKAVLLDDEVKLAFAAVKFFKADTTILFQKAMSFQELQTVLGAWLPASSFVAIHIKTRFSDVAYRSFKKQERPFVTTKKAMADTLHQKNLEAEMVGFYTPKGAQLLNSPSFHFHMVDKNRTTGGHVLGAHLDYAAIEVDYAQGLEIALPTPAQLKTVDLTKPGE